MYSDTNSTESIGNQPFNHTHILTNQSSLGETIGAGHDQDYGENGVTLCFEFTTTRITVEVGHSIVLGRVHPSSIFIPDLDLTYCHPSIDGVSRLHASLAHRETGWFLTDLNSSNGTWLNGIRLAPNDPQELSTDSRVRLAHIDLVIQLSIK